MVKSNLVISLVPYGYSPVDQFERSTVWKSPFLRDSTLLYTVPLNSKYGEAGKIEVNGGKLIFQIKDMAINDTGEFFPKLKPNHRHIHCASSVN